jgi:hypothetical protein
MMTELFQQALHINAPWLIKSIDFNAEEKRLDIQIDFKRGSTYESNFSIITLYSRNSRM